MTTAKGTIDYPTVLKRVPAGTRERIYKDLMAGKNGQPGIEDQFVAALVEYRSFAEAVASREGYKPEGETDKDQWLNDLGMMRYTLYAKKEHLDVIAAELARLQDALEEITGAGVATA